jgi:hypothetical protein
MRRHDTTQQWGSTYWHVSKKSRKAWGRPNVGQGRVWFFIAWQDEMQMRWYLFNPGSPEDILHVVHSSSVTPICPYIHFYTFAMYLEAMIEQVCRCTRRLRSSDLRDAHAGHDWARLDLHFEAVIKQVWTSNGWPRLSEVSDTHQIHDPVSFEMQLQSGIPWTQQYTGRPW